MADSREVDRIGVASLDDAIRLFLEAVKPQIDLGQIDFHMSGHEVTLFWASHGEHVLAAISSETRQIWADSFEHAIELLKENTRDASDSAGYLGCIAFRQEGVSGRICWDLAR